MKRLEIDQVRCFLAVVDTGNLVRAAATLAVSPPALSETLSGLEREVGTKLFHRLPRGLRLTSAGQELLPVARRIMRDLETARSSVAHATGAGGGRLVVGVNHGLVSGSVSSLVCELRHAHPLVRVRLVEAGEEEALDRVYTGGFDLAFTALPTASRYDMNALTAELALHKFEASEVVLVLPPGTGADLPPRLSFAALPNLPLIAANVSSPHQVAVLTHLGAAQAMTDLAVTTDHWHAILPLVLSGVGMAWARGSEALEAIQLSCPVRPVTPPVLVQNFVVRRPGILQPPAEHLLAAAIEHGRQSGVREEWHAP